MAFSTRSPHNNSSANEELAGQVRILAAYGINGSNLTTMSQDRTVGVVITMRGLPGIMLYAWLLYVDGIALLQMAGSVGVSIVFAVLAWIGWTMPTISSMQHKTREEGPSKAKVP